MSPKKVLPCTSPILLLCMAFVSAGVCEDPATCPVSTAEACVSGPANVVTCFGADPTDDQDDSVCIQEAICAAEADGGGVVLLPAGEYVLESTVILRRGVTLQGEGPDATRLTAKATLGTSIATPANFTDLCALSVRGSNIEQRPVLCIAGDFEVIDENNDGIPENVNGEKLEQVTLQDFTLDMRELSNGEGIRLYNASQVQIDNVHIKGYSREEGHVVGVFAQVAFGNQMTGSLVSMNRPGDQNQDAQTGSGADGVRLFQDCNAFSVRDSRIFAENGRGIVVSDSRSVTIENVTVEGRTTVGIDAGTGEANTYAVQFPGSNPPVQLDAVGDYTSGLTITGSYFTAGCFACYEDPARPSACSGRPGGVDACGSTPCAPDDLMERVLCADKDACQGAAIRFGYRPDGEASNEAVGGVITANTFNHSGVMLPTILLRSPPRALPGECALCDGEEGCLESVQSLCRRFCGYQPAEGFPVSIGSNHFFVRNPRNHHLSLDGGGNPVWPPTPEADRAAVRVRGIVPVTLVSNRMTGLCDGPPTPLLTFDYGDEMKGKAILLGNLPGEAISAN